MNMDPMMNGENNSKRASLDYDVGSSIESLALSKSNKMVLGMSLYDEIQLAQELGEIRDGEIVKPEQQTDISSQNGTSFMEEDEMFSDERSSTPTPADERTGVGQVYSALHQPNDQEIDVVSHSSAESSIQPDSSDELNEESETEEVYIIMESYGDDDVGMMEQLQHCLQNGLPFNMDSLPTNIEVQTLEYTPGSTNQNHVEMFISSTFNSMPYDNITYASSAATTSCFTKSTPDSARMQAKVIELPNSDEHYPNGDLNFDSVKQNIIFSECNALSPIDDELGTSVNDSFGESRRDSLNQPLLSDSGMSASATPVDHNNVKINSSIKATVNEHLGLEGSDSSSTEQLPIYGQATDEGVVIIELNGDELPILPATRALPYDSSSNNSSNDELLHLLNKIKEKAVDARTELKMAYVRESYLQGELEADEEHINSIVEDLNNEIEVLREENKKFYSEMTQHRTANKAYKLKITKLENVIERLHNHTEELERQIYEASTAISKPISITVGCMVDRNMFSPQGISRGTITDVDRKLTVHRVNQCVSAHPEMTSQYSMTEHLLRLNASTQIPVYSAGSFFFQDKGTQMQSNRSVSNIHCQTIINLKDDIQVNYPGQQFEFVTERSDSRKKSLQSVADGPVTNKNESVENGELINALKENKHLKKELKVLKNEFQNIQKEVSVIETLLKVPCDKELISDEIGQIISSIKHSHVFSDESENRQNTVFVNRETRFKADFSNVKSNGKSASLASSSTSDLFKKQSGYKDDFIRRDAQYERASVIAAANCAIALEDPSNIKPTFNGTISYSKHDNTIGNSEHLASSLRSRSSTNFTETHHPKQQEPAKANDAFHKKMQELKKQSSKHFPRSPSTERLTRSVQDVRAEHQETRSPRYINGGLGVTAKKETDHHDAYITTRKSDVAMSKEYDQPHGMSMNTNLTQSCQVFPSENKLEADNKLSFSTGDLHSHRTPKSKAGPQEKNKDDFSYYDKDGYYSSKKHHYSTSANNVNAEKHYFDQSISSKVESCGCSHTDLRCSHLDHRSKHSAKSAPNVSSVERPKQENIGGWIPNNSKLNSKLSNNNRVQQENIRTGPLTPDSKKQREKPMRNTKGQSPLVPSEKDYQQLRSEIRRIFSSDSRQQRPNDLNPGLTNAKPVYDLDVDMEKDNYREPVMHRGPSISGNDRNVSLRHKYTQDSERGGMDRLPDYEFLVTRSGDIVKSPRNPMNFNILPNKSDSRKWAEPKRTFVPSSEKPSAGFWKEPKMQGVGEKFGVVSDTWSYEDSKPVPAKNHSRHGSYQNLSFSHGIT